MVCPSDQDCINSRCADPCDHYTVLRDAWRATDYSDGKTRCDQSVKWQGWYRLFLGQRSAQMSETCVKKNMCGTHAPLWITQPHPTVSDGISQRKVCGHWSNNCCDFKSNPIHVKNCHKNYYVYKLVTPAGCSLAYCAGKSGENCPLGKV